MEDCNSYSQICLLSARAALRRDSEITGTVRDGETLATGFAREVDDNEEYVDDLDLCSGVE